MKGKSMPDELRKGTEVRLRRGRERPKSGWEGTRRPEHEDITRPWPFTLEMGSFPGCEHPRQGQYVTEALTRLRCVEDRPRIHVGKNLKFMADM